MEIVLKKPVITEKSMKMAALGLYTFLVNRKARKPQICKAVEKAFGVEVIGVQTISGKSQKKMQRAKRRYFEVAGYKKAVISLKEGQKIALFETETGTKEEESAKIVKVKKSLLKGTRVKVERGSKEKEIEPGGERNV